MMRLVEVSWYSRHSNPGSLASTTLAPGTDQITATGGSGGLGAVVGGTFTFAASETLSILVGGSGGPDVGGDGRSSSSGGSGGLNGGRQRYCNDSHCPHSSVLWQPYSIANSHSTVATNATGCYGPVMTKLLTDPDLVHLPSR